MVLYVGAGLGAKAWDIYTPYAVWIKIDDRDVAVAFARSCIASTIIYIDIYLVYGKGLVSIFLKTNCDLL